MANASSTKEAKTVATPARAGGNPPGPGRAPRRAPTVSSMSEYLQGVREELRKAQWPTRAELIRLTQVVLAVIAVVAAFVGGLDAILGWLTRKIGFGS